MPDRGEWLDDWELIEDSGDSYERCAACDSLLRQRLWRRVQSRGGGAGARAGRRLGGAAMRHAGGSAAMVGTDPGGAGLPAVVGGVN